MEEEEANLDLSSEEDEEEEVIEDDNKSLNFRDNLSNLASNISGQRTYVVRKGMKSINQISTMGVKGFRHVTALNRLNVDESPYQLVAASDPQYLDIICVNCNECIRYNEVDMHSSECSKIHIKDKVTSSPLRNGADLNSSYNFDIEKDLKKIFA